jgi:hypothetical protein
MNGRSACISSIDRPAASSSSKTRR